MTSDRYDVTAKASGNPTPREMNVMLQALHAERFKLVLHTEVREQPIYALVLARADGGLGSQIQPSSLDCDAMTAARLASRPVDVPAPANGAPPCGSRMSPNARAYSGTTLGDFGSTIADSAGRRVIDKTGLTGRFDITLNVARRPTPGQTAADEPSIFTALQEQLGLKLVPDRAPLRTLVIDHIERPTEN